MEATNYDWRCMCGAENKPKTIYCAECGKQRWSQLGVSAVEARGLCNAVLPGYLAERSIQAA